MVNSFWPRFLSYLSLTLFSLVPPLSRRLSFACPIAPGAGFWFLHCVLPLLGFFLFCFSWDAFVVFDFRRCLFRCFWFDYPLFLSLCLFSALLTSVCVYVRVLSTPAVRVFVIWSVHLPCFWFVHSSTNNFLFVLSFFHRIWGPTQQYFGLFRLHSQLQWRHPICNCVCLIDFQLVANYNLASQSVRNMSSDDQEQDSTFRFFTHFFSQCFTSNAHFIPLSPRFSFTF